MSSVLASLKGPAAIVALIYAAIVMLAAIDWGFLRNEITDYPLLCEDAGEQGTCRRVGAPLHRRTFKVMVDRQEVVYWWELGVGHARPERLTRCAVRDRRNWVCRYPDESAAFGFSSGAYWETILKPTYMVGTDKRELHVGRWRYYNQQCGGYFRALLLCLPLDAVMAVFMSWVS